jgi:hypothetical protein
MGSNNNIEIKDWLTYSHQFSCKGKAFDKNLGYEVYTLNTTTIDTSKWRK